MESFATRKIKAQIINGFIDNEQGGNLAAVVFDADNISDEDKLKIAGKLGLSETAFLSSSTIADYKLDFFTPLRRIAHCGHATIAAFSYLRQKGILLNDESSKETVDGIRKIILKGNNAFMEQVAPKYTSVKDDMNTILESLGLQKTDLIDEAQPYVINTGNSFLIIGLKEKKVLEKLQYDIALVSKLSEKYGLIGFYIFCKETVIPGRDASSRMFGPFYGIPEESATGMAAGPLACYFYDKLNIKKEHFLIEQGHFMKEPSPSLITVDLSIKDNSITGLLAGGKGKLMRYMEIEY